MISVIIPALNEAKALPNTLGKLLAQDGHYEIVLVDGGSDDDTLAIARAHKRVRVLKASRGRALQMNTGAAASRGELLLFLHADTILPPRAIERLNALEASCEIQAGGFRQQFSGATWMLQVISRLHNWRCGRTGIIYGDQAMFVARKLFAAVGGFPLEPVLEDVALPERLLEHTRPRLMEEYVITDSRKFEQMGAWRSLMRCALILICYELRLPILGRAFFSPIR